MCYQTFLIAGNKTIQGLVWFCFVLFFLTVAFLGLRLKGLRIAAGLYLDGLLQVDMLSWNSGSPDSVKRPFNILSVGHR